MTTSSDLKSRFLLARKCTLEPLTMAHRMMAESLLADARALVGTPAAFGDRKVFLSALLGPVAGQDMSELDELRAWGLLTFARADLVAAMDPAMVAASEWRVGCATYHFLVLPAPRGQEPYGK